jgi:hypothetical protein
MTTYIEHKSSDCTRLHPGVLHSDYEEKRLANEAREIHITITINKSKKFFREQGAAKPVVFEKVQKRSFRSKLENELGTS